MKRISFFSRDSFQRAFRRQLRFEGLENRLAFSLWNPIDLDDVPSTVVPRTQMTNFDLFSLNTNELKSQVEAAPHEFSDNHRTSSFPFRDQTERWRDLQFILRQLWKMGSLLNSQTSGPMQGRALMTLKLHFALTLHRLDFTRKFSRMMARTTLILRTSQRSALRELLP